MSKKDAFGHKNMLFHNLVIKETVWKTLTRKLYNKKRMLVILFRSAVT